MRSCLTVPLALCALVLTGVAPAQPAARTDAHGLPLPPGAVARLGSVRLRQPDTVCAIAFAPDGKSLYSAGGDRVIRQWDVASGKEIGSLAGHTEEVRGLAVTPDGKCVLSVALEKNARLRNLANDKESQVLEGHDDGIEGLALSRDGAVLATAGRDGKVGLWDVATGEHTRWLKGHDSGVAAVTFSPDGKTLASAGEDRTVRTWIVETGKSRHLLKGHTDKVEAVAFAPDGKTIGSGSKDGTIRLWDAATGKERTKWTTRLTRIWSLCFDHEGKRLLVGGEGAWENLVSFDVETGKEAWARPAHLPGPRRPSGSDFRTPLRGTACVVLSPDGKTLASGGVDGRVRLWEAATGRDVSPHVGHQDTVSGVAFLPGGKGLITGSLDGSLRWWDVTGKERSRIIAFPAGVSALVLSRDGKQVVAAGGDGSLGIWDAAGKKVRDWKGPAGPVHCLALSPDGRTLASTAPADKATLLVLWDLEGNERKRLSLEEDVQSVVFSPDGKVLAAVSKDEPIHFWDTATGKPRDALPDRLRGVTRLAYSHDGAILIGGFGGSRSVVLWETATGKQLAEFDDEGSPIVDIACSADGQTIIAAHADEQVRLWESRTGKVRRVIRPHVAPVSALCLSPDGTLLATASADQTVLLLRRWATEESAAGLSVQRLHDVWQDLASDEADRAYSAMCSLVAAPEQGLAFLKPRLAPLPKLDNRQIDQWIANLDARSFKAREEAMDNLARLGRLVEDRLKAVLTMQPTLEMRRRVEQLLKRLEDTGPGEEWRRVGRAIEIVEQIGGEAAIDILGKLADGGDFKPTREARAALERLKRRAREP